MPRKFTRRTFLFGGALAGAAVAGALHFGVIFNEPHPNAGIRAIINVPCADSRHVSRIVRDNVPFHPDAYMHVSNAGAHPGPDLEGLIDHLVNVQGLKRKEILVIGTSHWDPGCGGAQVTPDKIKHIQEALHRELHFTEQHVGDYLTSYGHKPEDVLSSVPLKPSDRSLAHGDILKSYRVHYVVGNYEMDEHTFRPIAYSDESLLKHYSLEGIDFDESEELKKGQSPNHLILSVPGVNGRGSPEGGSPHWRPGRSFFVSVNPAAPSAKSQLSILYYAYLTAEARKKEGKKIEPFNLVLSGTQKQVDVLRELVKRDSLMQHMLKKKFWILKEKVRSHAGGLID